MQQLLDHGCNPHTTEMNSRKTPRFFKKIFWGPSSIQFLSTDAAIRRPPWLPPSAGCSSYYSNDLERWWACLRAGKLNRIGLWIAFICCFAISAQLTNVSSIRAALHVPHTQKGSDSHFLLPHILESHFGSKMYVIASTSSLIQGGERESAYLSLGLVQLFLMP